MTTTTRTMMTQRDPDIVIFLYTQTRRHLENVTQIVLNERKLLISFRLFVILLTRASFALNTIKIIFRTRTKETSMINLLFSLSPLPPLRCPSSSLPLRYVYESYIITAYDLENDTHSGLTRAFRRPRASRHMRQCTLQLTRLSLSLLILSFFFFFFFSSDDPRILK